MKLRAYKSTDKQACLAIFDSNVPQYFAKHERIEFVQFLDNPICTYFVVENESAAVIGCGGYHYDPATHESILCWGMVTRDHHKTGVGKFLLRERLKRLCADSDGQAVLRLNTSQHTYGFFEKFGFVVTKIIENGFALGLHEYDMLLTMTPDYCAALSRTTDTAGRSV